MPRTRFELFKKTASFAFADLATKHMDVQGRVVHGDPRRHRAEEAIAHRHLNRFSPLFELRDGRAMARRFAVVGKRLSSVTMIDRSDLLFRTMS